MRLGLVLGEALSGLRRNVSMVIAVVLVTFISLTFMGAALLMQMEISKMRSFWAERSQVSVFMCSSVSTAPTCSGGVATDDQIASVKAQLEGDTLSPLIKNYTFQTSQQTYDEAMKLLGNSYKDITSPEQFNATFSINLVDENQSDVIIEAFQGTQGVEEVKDQMQYLEPLFSALTVSSYLAVGIGVLMLITAVLLISTTIRLSAFARRKEIGIMRLVGASNRFIQTPFVLEGVIAALIGSVLASGAIWASVQFGVNGYLKERLAFVASWVGGPELAVVIPVVIAIGVVLSALSAGFAIRRWLRT